MGRGGDNLGAVRIISHVRDEARLVAQYPFLNLVSCLTYLSKLNSTYANFGAPFSVRGVISAGGTI